MNSYEMMTCDSEQVVKRTVDLASTGLFDVAAYDISSPISAIGRVRGFYAAGQAPSASRDGSLAYLSRGEGSGTLVRRGRRGALIEVLSPPAPGLGSPAISPAGRRIAASSMLGSENLDLWIYDLDRSAHTRLTFEVGTENVPSWSPDGTEIVYRRGFEGRWRLQVTSADGSGESRSLETRVFSADSPDWSRRAIHRPRQRYA